jgi:hypothetical protein
MLSALDLAEPLDSAISDGPHLKKAPDPFFSSAFYDTVFILERTYC